MKKLGSLVCLLAVTLALVLTGCPDPATGGDPPGIPQNVQATAVNATTIEVTWDPVEGATQYNVYKRTGTSSSTVLIASPTSTSYTDSNLSSGTTYHYTVSARNSNGEGTQSATSSATPTATPVPAAPTGVAGRATSTASIGLTWNATANTYSYKVYYRAGTSGEFIQLSPQNTITSNGTNITGLISGTTYFFRVVATNQHGDSAQSAISSGVRVPSNSDQGATAANSINVNNTAHSIDAWTSYSLDGRTELWFHFNSNGTGFVNIGYTETNIRVDVYKSTTASSNIPESTALPNMSNLVKVSNNRVNIERSTFTTPPSSWNSNTDGRYFIKVTPLDTLDGYPAGSFVITAAFN